jgi:hypothetical protein
MGHLPNPQCVVKVGDGRGFIVEYRVNTSAFPKHPKIRFQKFIRHRVVVTAAHCLPNLPPAHPAAYSEERTFPKLLGSLDGKKKDIWTECLFVDPVADIAVLGTPDTQELFEQADAYEALTDGPMLRIAEAKNGKGWMLSLKGEWVPTALEVNHATSCTGLSTGPNVPGQSGSPILNGTGLAIGVVSVGGAERIGPQPILRDSLPAWMLK